MGRLLYASHRYLTHEWRHQRGTKRKFGLKMWEVRVPQQPNSSDCGLFMLHFTELFMTCRAAPFHPGNLDQRNWFDPEAVSAACHATWYHRVLKIRLTLLRCQRQVHTKMRGHILAKLEGLRAGHDQSQKEA